MTVKAIGLIFRFGLNKVGIQSEGFYNDLIRDYQPQVNYISALSDELKPALLQQKKEVVRIFAEAQGKASGGDYQGAADQFSGTLVSILDVAYPAAQVHVPKRNTYDTRRPPIEVLYNNLSSHAQKAHVAAELNAAKDALKNAPDNAKIGELDDALIDLNTAKTKCEQGKTYADEFAKYVPKRAAAGVLVWSCKGAFANKAKWQEYMDKLTAADNDAAGHNYADACKDVDAVGKKLKTTVKDWYVEDPKPLITTLKNLISGKPVAAWLDPDIQQIDATQAQSLVHFNNGAWAQCRMSCSSVESYVAAATKAANRRIQYDNEKVTTNAAINGLNAQAPVAGRIAAMQQLVTAADDLASHDKMQVEAGIAALKKIAGDCAALLLISPEATGYATERTSADTKYTNLERHAAAANIVEPLATIKAQLEAATKLAEALVNGAAVVSGNPKQDFKAARKIVAQAAANITEAEKLAASLADTTASQTAAANAGNKDAIDQAVTELRRQVAAIKKPEADLVAEELAQVIGSLDEATRLAGAGKVDVAKTPLAGAADLLVQIKTGLAQHARITTEHAALTERLKNLQASTEPKAADLKNYIDPLAFHLVQANKQDSAGEWEKALAELRKGVAAADQAEAAAPLRKAFDTSYADLELRRTPLSDPLKGEVLATMTEAKNEADKFKFDAAKSKLGKAEAQLESARVTELATTDPANADFEDLAKKMLKAEGGGKLLDDLVQSIPETGNTVDAIIKLAKIRFGVEMKTDAGFQTQSIKKLWEMMAQVPGDTINNPSLKRVKRKDPTTDGGYYSGSKDLVVMNGRPGKETQKFGANILDELPAGGSDIYQPVNDDPVDYFDFSTLHEVGHAVDDRLRFMESRLGQAQFGGWTVYGSNIEPIVTAVGKMSDYNKQPAQTAYIRDLILRLKPTPPTPPDGKEVEWADNLKKVDDWFATATDGNVWYSQTDTGDIEIDGIVYHEAYKKDWVSYPFDERAKGLTGYQFRAPGEWFAELYAGFYAGKLKPSHPASTWLAELKVPA